MANRWNLLDKMKALIAIKKVRNGVNLVLSVAVVAVGGAAIYTVMNDKQVTTQETKVGENGKKGQKVLKYEVFHMGSDSMEKNMIIYFMDDDNQKVAGSTFAIKVVKSEEASKLKELINEISKTYEQIKPSSEDNTDTSEEKGTENSEKKETVIETYANVLGKLEGQVLTDDDIDGLIT